MDADEMLREYCRLFYGRAEAEMLAFFEYCEQNWIAMEEDKSKADEALALFEKAKGKVDAASVYSRRIALIDDFLKGLRMKSQQLGQKRGPVPVVRLVGDAENIVIDGKLDDEYWQRCPVAATGRFHELQTGRAPIFGTAFKAGWQGGSLYFAIRCDERPGDKPNNTSTREDDPAIWRGDVIEIELATETHSYYQIAVSPAGHVVDLDRGAPRGQWFTWDSKAEVATHVAEDHWTAEIRIPVTQDENDPLHQIIGRKPTQSLPWHINLCRQRIREDGQEHSALSPTGTEGFHEPMKFAHFYDGRSHKFEAAEMEEGYLKTSKAAGELMKNRKLEEAFTALVEFADGKASDFQKAAALEQAAGYALAGKRFDLADEVIDWIPIQAVEKTVRMRYLLAKQQAPGVVAQFGNEDIVKWPFWKRGDGFHARGRAHFIAKAGDKAEADLKTALEFTSDPRTRDSVLLLLAQNREQHLKNDDAALTSYHAIIDDRKQLGGADEFAALQGIARILIRRGQFDEALAVLNRVDAGKLPGVWKAGIAKSIEEVRKARK
ncbi:MAG: carbohydrate-binding family 9-like protein [Verrucomicrobiaceae bacterium]|nr:carbohydrate-binding family 9-like protein [Verrucomicrobiaceae bacterium]